MCLPWLIDRLYEVFRVTISFNVVDDMSLLILSLCSVYRKATHTSKYLDLLLHGPTQGKRAAVNILMDRAKRIPSTTEQRQSEE